MHAHTHTHTAAAPFLPCLHTGFLLQILFEKTMLPSVEGEKHCQRQFTFKNKGAFRLTMERSPSLAYRIFLIYFLKCREMF
jgi:hypothetical protein